jgi:hypothetical protein
VENDTAYLARIYSETLAKLESFSRRVAEGRDINAASEFARWLPFSGILSLLDRYPNQVASHNPLKVDGRFLRWKAEQLTEACNDRYRTNNQNPAIERTEFEAMREKIDRMAGYLSRLTAAGAIRGERIPEPQPNLKVVQGGLPE